MKRIPMPSPRGSNHAGLFISTTGPLAAYDAAMLDDDGAPIADSSLSHKILTGCAGNLNGAEMSKLIGMLVEADMLSKEEARSIGESLNSNHDPDDSGDDPSMASDSIRMSRRREAYRKGLIGLDAVRAPPFRRAPPMDAVAFPHANRLK